VFTRVQQAGAVIAACAVLFVAARASAQQPQRRDITLQVGEQSSIPADGVRNYSEGVPNVVDVRLPRDNSQFIIVALHPGQTTLLLTMDDGSQVLYRIVVTSGTETTTGLQARDNIRLDLYFVQVSDYYSHRIGVGWMPYIGGPSLNTNITLDLTTGTFSPAQLIMTNQPLPRIDLLQSNGWAKIMRQAAIVTANGNEATFDAGGELNIRIASGFSIDIRKIRFGSEIKVLPQYDRASGRIELKILAEQSDLTEDRAGTGLPGRTTTHVETVVSLEMGQAIMLAGITLDTENETRAGLPGLSQIPIFGALFGTHSGTSDQTRNVLFIVPTVVDVVSQQSRDRIGETLQIWEDYTGGASDVELFEPIHGNRAGGRGSAASH
jgi:pilus assembly protein CpaC